MNDTDETETGHEETPSNIYPRLEDQSKQREIGECTYRVQPTPFDKSFPALLRLIRLVSPVLAGFFREKGINLRVAAIFDHVPAILTDAEMKYFAETFGPYSWVLDGDNEIPLTMANRNRHFNTRHLAYLRWLIFAMEVNFAGFFDGIQGEQGNLKDVLAMLNLSTESTGGNGSAGAS